jgi:hypothetical protein
MKSQKGTPFLPRSTEGNVNTNERSEEIVRNKSNLKGINEKVKKHKELYEYYKQKKQLQDKRTEDFYSKYTFSPKVNSYNFNLNFFSRQEVYKHLKLEKEKE